MNYIKKTIIIFLAILAILSEFISCNQQPKKNDSYVEITKEEATAEITSTVNDIKKLYIVTPKKYWNELKKQFKSYSDEFSVKISSDSLKAEIYSGSLKILSVNLFLANDGHVNIVNGLIYNKSDLMKISNYNDESYIILVSALSAVPMVSYINVLKGTNYNQTHIISQSSYEYKVNTSFFKYENKPASGHIAINQSSISYIIEDKYSLGLENNNNYEYQASDAKSQETNVPETKAPETKAPETDPSETKAPETKEPETDPPETKAPETDPPETKAPETDPPETKAPETKEPEIETEPVTTSHIHTDACLKWVVDVPYSPAVYENQKVIDIPYSPAEYGDIPYEEYDYYYHITIPFCDIDESMDDFSSTEQFENWLNKNNGYLDEYVNGNGYVTLDGTEYLFFYQKHDKYLTVKYKYGLIKPEQPEVSHLEKVLVSPEQKEKGHYEYICGY